MNKNYNIGKAALWYTIGNVLIKGVSFFVLPIFTALMSTEEYGIFSIYTSYVSIFEVIILLGLSSTVRIAKFDEQTDFDKYMGTISYIPIVATILSGIFINLYFLINPSIELLSMGQSLWNFLLVTSACSAVSGIVSAKLVIDMEYKKYMAYSMLNVLSSIGISLLLCYTIFRNHDIYMARVWGMCLSSIISLLFLLKTSQIKLCLDKTSLKKGLIWGIPLLFHTLATVILTQSDRIIINQINGYSAAGIYSIAVTMITIPLTLYTSFESAWAPWFYEKLKNKEYEIIKDVNNKYIIFFATIIAGFMLLCPDVIHIFTNFNYWDSVYSLIPLSISVFGEMLYSLPVNIEYYNKKTLWITAGTIMTVIINIGLDVVFIMQWGYIAAAYATSLSKLILFVFHLWLSKRIDKNDIFGKRTVLIALISLFSLNVFAVYMVNNTLVRVVATIIICILFAIWVNKNKEDFKLFLHIK